MAQDKLALKPPSVHDRALSRFEHENSMCRPFPMVNNSVKAFDLKLDDLAYAIKNNRITLCAFAFATNVGAWEDVLKEIRQLEKMASEGKAGAFGL